MTDIAATIKLVAEWAREARDDQDNDWPGVPISSLPLSTRDALHAAIREGLVKIVERPSITASRGTATYVVPVGK